MSTPASGTLPHALGAGARGAATAVAALGAAELAALVTGAGSPIDDAARISVDHSPQVVVEETVRLLGTADKPAVRAASAASTAAALSLAQARGPRTRLASVAALLALDAWAGSRVPPGRTPLAHAAVAGAAGATALTVHRLPPAWTAAAAIAGVVAAGSTARVRAARLDGARERLTAEPLAADEPLPPFEDGAHDWPGVEPLPTPTDRWFATDVNLRPPLVDRDTWTLRVDGHVERALTLDDAELRVMGTVEVDVAVVCIHTRPGWLRQGTLRVVGVPVSRVLETAGVLPGAVDVRSVAVDGFDARHGVGMLRDTSPEAPALVVLGVDGHRLTPEHGAPARLLVPGLYGQYAGVKWLTRLEVTDHRADFYWESRGWPVAVQGVRPTSRIDAVDGTRVPVGSDGRTLAGARGRISVPTGTRTVTGSAWAPRHGGVAAVEVCLDDGEWRPVELAAEVSPGAQRRWRTDLDLAPGGYRVQVRVRAADGTPQVAEPSPPGFTGATGLHRVGVDVG